VGDPKIKACDRRGNEKEKNLCVAMMMIEIHNKRKLESKLISSSSYTRSLSASCSKRWVVFVFIVMMGPHAMHG